MEEAVPEANFPRDRLSRDELSMEEVLPVGRIFRKIMGRVVHRATFVRQVNFPPDASSKLS